MPVVLTKSRTSPRPRHHMNGHGRKLRTKSIPRQDYKDLVGRDDEEYMVLETLYMKPDLVRRLRMLAQRQRKSKSQLIREMLADGVRRTEKTAISA